MAPDFSRVNSPALLGLSLTRKGPRGHPDSSTHNQVFDLDLIQDRDQKYIYSTNDEGWLAGGGEPPTGCKLPALDSAHMEIMRVTNHSQIVEILQSGQVLIPEMTVVPTSVVAKGDELVDLQVRFDTAPSKLLNLDDPMAALPLNWQLQFVQNQLLKILGYSSRFEPGNFHVTIAREAEFRSPKAKAEYFAKCQLVLDKWVDRGQQPLPIDEKTNPNIRLVKSKRHESYQGEEYMVDLYRSGLSLFVDRGVIRQNTIHRKPMTHHFLPNFPPPYDSPAKRRIISRILKESLDGMTTRTPKN